MKKHERLCLRCGHQDRLHDDKGGVCAGTMPMFDFDPERGYIETGEGWMCGCSGFLRAGAEISVSTVMFTHDLVWSQLMGHGDPDPGEHNDRGYWRPSSLGACLRRQYLWRSGVPATRVEDEREVVERERKFAWGRDLEDHVADRMERAGLLISRQASLSDDDLRLKGNMDFIWGGGIALTLPERSKYWSPRYRWAVLTVRSKLDEIVDEYLPITGVEIKSTHSWAIRKAYDEGPRFDWRCQAGAYWLMAQRHPEQLPVSLDRFQIVAIGRDAVHPLTFEASDAEAQLASDRVGALNDYWRRQEQPPCTCATGEIGYDQSRYCPYPNADGDGCCGSNLFDLLEQSVQRAEARAR